MIRVALMFGLVTCLGACSAPDLREVACADGVDDDLDELVDCEDPDCIELTEVCEVTLARCRDRADGDRNGRTDCEDESCRDNGFCANETVDYCRVFDGAECPTGYACYSTLGFEAHDCVVPGDMEIRRPGDPCDLDLLPTGGCRPGTFCRANVCTAACRTIRDCAADSICFRTSDQDNGFCTNPCDYSLAMPTCLADGAGCGPLQAVGEVDVNDRRFAVGVCLSVGAFEFGVGEVGDPCGPTLAQRCGEGLLCIADWRGVTTCRDACLGFVGDPTSGECPAGTLCEPILPTHPNLDTGDLAQGYCREDAS